MESVRAWPLGFLERDDRRRPDRRRFLPHRGIQPRHCGSRTERGRLAGRRPLWPRRHARVRLSRQPSAGENTSGDGTGGALSFACAGASKNRNTSCPRFAKLRVTRKWFGSLVYDASAGSLATKRIGAPIAAPLLSYTAQIPSRVRDSAFPTINHDHLHPSRHYAPAGFRRSGYHHAAGCRTHASRHARHADAWHPTSHARSDHRRTHGYR